MEISQFYGHYFENAANASYLARPSAGVIASERAELDVLFSLKTGGSFLDVGIGSGTGYRYAESRGYDAYGIEPSDALVAAARTLLPADRQDHVHHGLLHEKPFAGRKFDLISCRSVVEHLACLHRDFTALRETLKDDGVVFISTENYHSPDAQALGTRFPYLIPPQHLNFFSVDSLKQMLRKSGFEDIHILTPGLPWFTGMGRFRLLRHNPLVNLIASRFVNRGPITKCWASPSRLGLKSMRQLHSGASRTRRQYWHILRYFISRA